MANPSGKDAVPDISRWAPDVNTPAEPAPAVQKSRKVSGKGPSQTEPAKPAGYYVQPKAALVPHVPRRPRGYKLQYPPTHADSLVKLGGIIWASQRDWLKKASIDQQTTAQDLLREAIDDLRAKIVAEGKEGIDSH